MFTPTKKIMDFLDKPVHFGLNLFLCLNRICPLFSFFKIGYMTRDNAYFIPKLRAELKNIGNCFFYIFLFLLICGFYQDLFSEKSIYYLLITLSFFLLFKFILLSQICSGLILFVICYVYHVGILLGDIFLFWGTICFLISEKKFHFATIISSLGAYFSAQESVLYAEYFYVLLVFLGCFEIFLLVNDIRKKIPTCIQSESVKKIINFFGKEIDDEDIIPKLTRICFYKYYQIFFVIACLLFLVSVSYFMYQDIESILKVKNFYFPEWGVFVLQFIFICIYICLFPDLAVYERVLIFITFVVFMTVIPNMCLMVLLLGLAFCYLTNAYMLFFLLLKCIAVDFILLLLNCGISFRQGAIWIAIVSLTCFLIAWRKQHD